MSVLLVDIGNSRVKWARLERGVLGEQSAAARAGWTAEHWRSALFAGGTVERVIVSSVSGGATAALADVTRQVTGRDPEFVTTTREAAGVRNGYADPSLLDVDRWLAVIGAYQRVQGACVVADFGTAATVEPTIADSIRST